MGAEEGGGGLPAAKLPYSKKAKRKAKFERAGRMDGMMPIRAATSPRLLRRRRPLLFFNSLRDDVHPSRSDSYITATTNMQTQQTEIC